MKKLSCILSLILFFFIMSGCLHKNSTRVQEVHLQKDELALKHLTQAYQKEKIGALAYVQGYNILNKRIQQNKKILEDKYKAHY